MRSKRIIVLGLILVLFVGCGNNSGNTQATGQDTKIQDNRSQTENEEENASSIVDNRKKDDTADDDAPPFP